jgi:hypothetical protein
MLSYQVGRGLGSGRRQIRYFRQVGTRRGFRRGKTGKMCVTLQAAFC